jgi:hypothetical protein
MNVVHIFVFAGDTDPILSTWINNTMPAMPSLPPIGARVTVGCAGSEWEGGRVIDHEFSYDVPAEDDGHGTKLTIRTTLRKESGERRGKTPRSRRRRRSMLDGATASSSSGNR